MKKTLLWLGFVFSIFSESIALVHLGEEIPPYVFTSIKQASLFNPDTPIYLIVNQQAAEKNFEYKKRKKPFLLKNDPSPNLKFVFCEDLIQSPHHKKFLKKTKLDKDGYGGLWLYSSERFFYLWELMEKYELQDLFHIETDVMLYFSIEELLPIFQTIYPGKIGTTFDNDERAIPGFLYISSKEPLERLVCFMAESATMNLTDMAVLSRFRWGNNEYYAKPLPIIFPQYVQDHPLISQRGDQTKLPIKYFESFFSFNSIFDAACIGQYLGGDSPRNGNKNPGFINESSLINPSYFTYVWEKDEHKRLVPYIIYKDTKIRINNLHIHSKNLSAFLSKK